MSGRILSAPTEHTLVQTGLVIIPTPKAIEAYYDPRRCDYLIENSRGGYVPINETNMKRLLRQAGFSCKIPDERPLSPIEQELVRLQRERDVEYVGPLAGYPKGLHQIEGKRILVTESPKLIEPIAGESPLLNQVFNNLLGVEQLPFFMGWLKVAFESVRTGQRRPGQVLCLAGPHDSGKSLVQGLITVMIGGRSAKPYRYMSGSTAFNADLFAAEHLMIEDDIASTDIRKRRDFGTRIKDFSVNHIQSCHGKRLDALSLTPFWRVSITVNDEPENLMILPPLDDSLTDKIMLLKAHKHPMPMDTSTHEGRVAFRELLIAELPAFMHKLLSFEIPPDLRSQRFGISHYHNPELLSSINELSPEFRLLTLIDSPALDLFSCATKWTGTAEELKYRLFECGETRQEAQKLLDWSNATGTYLGRLAKKYAERFSSERGALTRKWVINSPIEKPTEE